MIIKPCPFCSKQPGIDSRNNSYRVNCDYGKSDCIADTTMWSENTEEAAIERWNTRHNPDRELLIELADLYWKDAEKQANIGMQAPRNL